MSAREYDEFGFVEIMGNPISKEGVYPYHGSEIQGAPDIDKVYMVYRPAVELSHPETIESFKLLPLTNDHPTKLLGLGVPAEKKGVDGVIGQDVYFDAPYLKGNIKIFSNNLQDLITDGKVELSPGYICKYEFIPGVFNGQKYDAIQREIRGNHLALVDEGRTGKDVAIMDKGFSFTIDSKEIMKAMAQDMENNVVGAGSETGMSMEEMANQFREMMPKVERLMEFMEKLKPMEEVEHKTSLDDVGNESDGMDKSDDEKKLDEIEKGTKDKESDKEDCNAMDAMRKELRAIRQEMASLKATALDESRVITQINKKNELVKKVSPFIGSFACDSMSYAQVAAYAAKKLGLKVSDDKADTAVEFYLHNRQPPTVASVAALDSSAISGENKKILSKFGVR